MFCYVYGLPDNHCKGTTISNGNQAFMPFGVLISSSSNHELSIFPTIIRHLLIERGVRIAKIAVVN